MDSQLRYLIRTFSLSILFSLSFADIPLEIHQVCNATRFPQICETSLTPQNLSQNPNPIEIVQSSIWVSTQTLKTAQKMVQTIIDTSSSNQNRSTSAQNCLQVLKYSEYRLSSTVVVLPRGAIKDARAWVSAALSYESGCIGGFTKFVNGSQEVNVTVAFLETVVEITSNTLSFLVNYDKFGNETALWRVPMTERDGVWEDGKASEGTMRGVLVDLAVNVTVCKGRAECYKTVQSAVDAAPDNYIDGKGRFVIRIEEGVYEETVRVPLEKKNVVFIGDGMGRTAITGSLSVGVDGINTYNTATVGVVGDGFMARDITFENTAGANANQAVAFRSESDLSIVENCEFLGNQDTLYAHSLRQYYNSCRIVGNVDFIFGFSTTVFENSQILVRPRVVSPEKGERNVVTAHGRSDPGMSTGFVFRNCVINGTDEYMALYYSKPKVHRNYLGRPWKVYSRTVYINCFLGALVSSDGWMPWDGGLSTLYYGEFQSYGPGANVTARVSWSSQVPAQHVNSYSAENFIQGDQWIPS
ncbi:hypothetical protein GIB67_036085 [Kingdonia uniflora]|uniref:pectinesterase n=1 Tax=Kingdonia uniflora TaxID=39325 RepID=A0A7J7N8Z2_9MAGN|nr:hypothetical protein GIB67_036085 [Kingdonia uniflora]